MCIHVSRLSYVSRLFQVLYVFFVHVVSIFSVLCNFDERTGCNTGTKLAVEKEDVADYNIVM